MNELIKSRDIDMDKLGLILNGCIGVVFACAVSFMYSSSIGLLFVALFFSLVFFVAAIVFALTHSDHD